MLHYCNGTKRKMKMDGERKQSWKFSRNEFSTVTNQQLKLSAYFTLTVVRLNKSKPTVTSTAATSTVYLPAWQHASQNCSFQIIPNFTETTREFLPYFYHVQMQNIKMACVCRIHNWGNWFSFLIFYFKDSAPTNRQFCQNPNIRKVSEMQIHPGN